MDNKYDIDATGAKLGRLATKLATILSGKNSPTFRKNQFAKNVVNVSNASKMDITSRKLAEITHNRYSGYPGGFTSVTGKKIIETKGYKALLRHAVSRMLPKTKHRETMLKNLIITD